MPTKFNKNNQGLHAQRKWDEFKMILLGNFPDKIVKGFYDTNISTHLGKFYIFCSCIYNFYI